VRAIIQAYSKTKAYNLIKFIDMLHCGNLK
jgi:hypothetical protein